MIRAYVPVHPLQREFESTGWFQPCVIGLVLQLLWRLVVVKKVGNGENPCKHPKWGNKECVTSLNARVLVGESSFTCSSHRKSFCWNSQLPKKSKPMQLSGFLRLAAPRTTCLESIYGFQIRNSSHSSQNHLAFDFSSGVTVLHSYTSKYEYWNSMCDCVAWRDVISEVTVQVWTAL